MRQQLRLLLKRPEDSYKYQFGHVLVVGGSPGLSGAVYLCSQAALKIGAGLVTAAVPKYLEPVMEIKTTEVMTLGLPQTNENLLGVDAFTAVNEFIRKRKVKVLVVGPGISTHLESMKLCLKLIKYSRVDLILDADALKSLKGNLNILNQSPARSIVITPHLGEFSYMTGLPVEKIKNNRLKVCKDFSLKYKAILVLKGHKTLIAFKGTVHQNTTGNPALSKAGSGDVLAGFIAGLIAQGRIEPFSAVKLGVYLHGYIADILKKEKTELCVMAQDLIEYLPLAIKKFK